VTTRTLGELVDDLRRRADLRGMTRRHPDVDLMRALTQSARSLRSIVTRAGSSVFLDGSTPAALPTAPPIAGEQFLEVDWPTGAVSIHGVDVDAGGRWYPLTPVQFGARRDYVHSEGEPRAFVVRSLPRESGGATLTAGKIQIYPLSSTGRTYRVWHLSELPELDDPNHSVHGFDGDWVEWILWDATVKFAAEDDDAQNVDGIASRERAILEERIRTNVVRALNSAGPLRPRRTRGYR
jgi:hypothetical protein